jgi:DNA helicase-2/ATP-dependent DNA helicase PcrA
VIGDPAQSIYGFRGGDAMGLLRFVEAHSGTRTVLLHRNYRSGPEIVRAASRLANGQLGLRPRSARRRGGRVDVAVYGDEETEAEAVFERVLSLANRDRGAEVAVLARVERHLALIERHLVLGGLPYRVLGGERALERAELRGALAYLRLAHNSRDLVACDLRRDPARGGGGRAPAPSRLRRAARPDAGPARGLPGARAVRPVPRRNITGAQDNHVAGDHATTDLALDRATSS